MPQTLEEVDRYLRDPDWAHLGRSRHAAGDQPQQQLYHGMVGPAGMRSLVYCFLNVVRFLTTTSQVFADGTFDIVANLPTDCQQMFEIVTNYMDHVST